ncbi:MAG: TonB-dependent receptor, partial [Cyclobacteriaceae bacterium]|nr:TonB-dependent receptor [Cyclobacteriaceae bacterium]
YDKPHDIVLVGNYSFTKRTRISCNFVYNTGRPITVPVSTFHQDQYYNVLNFSERNKYRIPDYHRFDIAFTVDEGHHKTRKYKSSWTFSIYNVYKRRNAFSVYFDQYGFAYRLSVLGAILPSLSYNFSFNE